ncbi:MAG: hypothetical protein K6F34_05275 [Lachnospiraceae bacterium]|nr:hypothetical protein [Lachnospiraceae bacterium]
MKDKKKQPTQINLMIRCIIAMYLIYLAHGIITELDNTQNVRLMVAFAILFTFTGVLIIAFTIKIFINKEYRDFREIDEPEDEKEEPTEGTVIDELVTDDTNTSEKEESEESVQDKEAE